MKSWVSSGFRDFIFTQNLWLHTLNLLCVVYLLVLCAAGWADTVCLPQFTLLKTQLTLVGFYWDSLEMV